MDTRIEILIDLSNSMGSMSGTPDQGKYLLPNGSTRMTLQKKILLDEILPTIDYAKRITIRTFHSRDAKLVAPIIYDGPFNLSSLQNAVFTLPSDPQNTGGTPIGLSTPTFRYICKKMKDKNRSIHQIISVVQLQCL